MNLEEKLQQLKSASKKTAREAGLERQLEYLRRLKQIPNQLPGQRVSRSIEDYIEGRVERCACGEFFLAEQELPFGRPYGRLRIGDVSAAVLRPLDLLLEGMRLPDSSRLVYLDTETTGLVGGTGTCAFLIGLGMVEGTGFTVRQFFLRDYDEEKAALMALSEALGRHDGLVTYNGRAFDVPLLETRYTLARLRSPFSRLVHLDLLHPARRLWKLRLESCQLTHLEKEILGIAREGDVPGSEIPGIYFDYLRTGNPRGLQPVFFHNALDIITLAALAVEMAGLLRDATCDGPSLGSCASLDLFGLSRIFARAGDSELSIAMGRRAVAAGLPEPVAPRALWHLASQHKMRSEFGAATELWDALTRCEARYALAAYRELAIHYERRLGNIETALQYTHSALERLRVYCEEPGGGSTLSAYSENFVRRRERLQKRLKRQRRSLDETGPQKSLSAIPWYV